MKLAILFLFSTLLSFGQLIDSGSDSDSLFVGGEKLDIIAPGDTTVRWSATGFAYEFPCVDGPYVVTFNWVEPTVTAAGLRLFTVKINDQLFFDRLDLFVIAGYRIPITRAVVAHCSAEKIVIKFTTQKRNALVSSIGVRPLPSVTGRYSWQGP
jgi:hypothetical protein